MPTDRTFDSLYNFHQPTRNKNMRLKHIQNKYAVIATITKSNSSYGNYAVRLKMPINHIEFFFQLREIVKFLDAHVKDLRSGNSL